MSVDPTLMRYRAPMRAVHWLTVIAVIVVFGITYLEGLFPRGSAGRAAIWWTHISVGLLLIGLIVARIALRLFGTMPPASPEVSRPLTIVSHVTHGLLYVLLVVTPLVGIYLAFLRGDAVSFFSLFTIPAPFPADRDLAHDVQEVHELLANALVVLALIHAAAAFYHHLVLKDDVFRRMLPGPSVR